MLFQYLQGTQFDLFERPIKTILFILRFYQLYHGTLLLLCALLTFNKF